jgi:hypothetical protein
VVGSGLLVAVSLRAAGGRRILIPLHDNIPTRHVPIVTWSLILVNAVVFAVELSLPGPVLEQR